MGLRVARRPRIPSLPVWTTGPTIAEGVNAAMLPLFKKERMWRTRDLKPSYDVVIVGAGVHGLATAYYLGSRHGIRRVALLEKGYLGSGNSGRNKIGRAHV